jgi:Protein of unknown function (DUF3309)
MSLSAILIALAILFIIATVPVWPYSRTWGCGRAERWVWCWWFWSGFW